MEKVLGMAKQKRGAWAEKVRAERVGRGRGRTFAENSPQWFVIE